MSRADRERLAAHTLRLLEVGEYVTARGTRVAFADALRDCVRRTRLHRAEDADALIAAARAMPASTAAAAIEVVNETTLAGIARLVADGATAIAGLYPSLLEAPEYYERHRSMTSGLYSDALIVSPECPVIRDDDGVLLEQPHRVTFVTSPAPNAGAIADHRPADLKRIPDVLRRRATCVLAAAAVQPCRTLVLGAWGCGVFRNDPSMVARVFEQVLIGERWAHRFELIRFSVFDTTPRREIHRAFAEVFGAAVG
jgi:hypothetical protein